MKGFKLLSTFLFLYFLIPTLLFLRFFTPTFQIDPTELLQAFKNSFTQSLSAALIVVLLSLPLSWGLFCLRGRWQTWVSRSLLVPQILPTFFSILIAFSIWKPFPFGHIGITWIFVIMHLGFATLLLHTATREKMGSYALVSEVFGFGHVLFLRRIYFPLMKNDLVISFLMIFIFSFGSFSVPLVAGGGKATTVELLIFEKAFMDQDFSGAWIVAILQTLFLASISWLVFRRSEISSRPFVFSQKLASKWGLAGIVIYLGVYFSSYALGLFQSLVDIQSSNTLWGGLNEATGNSLGMMVVYLILSLGLLYFWLLDFVRRGRLNGAQHLLSASTVMVGFTFYLTFPQSVDWDYIKVPWAISFLVFPVLFKSFLEKPLLQLKDQILTAQIYGISDDRIIFDVLLPALKRPLFVWYSFVVIWFLCDFATLRAMGTQSTTLSLMAESFLSSYRISWAYALSFFIIMVWIVVLSISTFLAGALSVLYQKFKYKI